MPKSASPPGRIAWTESASESARSESRWRYRNESSTCRKESDIAKLESASWRESSSCGERMPSAVTASIVRGPGRTVMDVSAPERY